MSQDQKENTIYTLNFFFFFSNIQLSTLEYIVSRRYLNLYSEFSLLNAVVQWAQHECKRMGQQVNDWAVVRNILNQR